MSDEELRTRVEQLQRDLRELAPEAGQGNLTTDAVLVLKTAIWARSEDPRRLAELTGVSLGEIHELAESFKQMGIWPLVEEP